MQQDESFEAFQSVFARYMPREEDNAADDPEAPVAAAAAAAAEEVPSCRCGCGVCCGCVWM